MPSTYSPDLRIELIGTGDQSGVWGSTTNNNLTYVIEQAVAGYVSVSVISTNQALTYLNGASAVAADNQSVHASLALTTTTSANFAVYAPPASKQFTIYNASAYTATILNSTVIGNTTAAGTGVAIPAGKVMTVWSDGTNFVQQNTHLTNPTLFGPTLQAPVLGTPASGTMTNVTGLPLTSAVTGILPTGNGGTGTASTTGTGANVFATSPTLVTPTLVTPILGTPTSGTMTNVTGLPLTTGVTGTLPVANGGTGVTTSTGSGDNVLSTSPTLTTPILGTPTSATLTNATGLPVSTGISGLGTGVATALAVNVGTAGAPVVNGGALGTPASGALTNCTFPTLNQNSTGTSGGISVAGGWAVTPSGTKLYFSYNGVNKASLDSSGNLIAVGNVTAYGTVT